MVSKIKIGNEIRRAWELYKNPDNFQLLLIVNFLTLVVGVLTLGILLGPMMAGCARITKRLENNDAEKPKPKDLFNDLDKTVATFSLFIILVLLMLVPLAGIIVGFLAPPLMWIGVMFIVFGKLGLSDTLKKIAGDMKDKNFWMLVLTMTIAGQIMMCGAIPIVMFYESWGIFIGVTSTFMIMPLATCTIVCAYHSAYGDGALAPAKDTGSLAIETEPGPISQTNTTIGSHAAARKPVKFRIIGILAGFVLSCPINYHMVMPDMYRQKVSFEEHMGKYPEFAFRCVVNFPEALWKSVTSSGRNGIDGKFNSMGYDMVMGTFFALLICCAIGFAIGLVLDRKSIKKQNAA